MVRLVVCDIDGTLLKKGETCLNPKISEAIKELKLNNIAFAAASGRAYSEMLNIFGNMKGIYYIPADGGAVVHENQILRAVPLPKFSVLNFVSKPNIIFHGVYNSYCSEDMYKTAVEKYGQSAVKIEFLTGGSYHNGFNTDIRRKSEEFFTDKDIIKISKHGAGYTEAPMCSYEVYKKGDCTEWIKAGAGKGEAVEFLQRKLGIALSETAVFGDNNNDLGMLRRGGLKYVMDKSVISGRVFGSKICCNIEDELRKFI